MKKKLLFVAGFAAALILVGTIPARASFGSRPLPAKLQVKPGSVAELPVATLALTAINALNADTYDLTVTLVVAGPNQPESPSGNVAPMTVAQRRAVARATFD